ncbi:hypothetical protein NJG16_01290 [Stenotrophomonas maltophilia]|uniref:hypothetical protein n=1 Tax=Stenotrophomonas lactitubi TaxID=2045214 RepID=UPI00203D3A44|nr:hypothetical protein [Stenotrophomonas lactitubi]MCO7468700.1 hypothetical protein [Stenotrophomonas maltophilia]
MDTTVTTARAAEIVGIGYEGLRSYLKRGLLGRSGVLIPMVGKDAAAPDLSTVRASWKRFGFTDLCLMRLAKQLIEMGLTYDQANSVVSQEGLRRLFRTGSPSIDAALVCSPPYHDYWVFKGDERRHLLDRLSEIGDAAILINLGATATHVWRQLSDDLDPVQ